LGLDLAVNGILFEVDDVARPEIALGEKRNAKSKADRCQKSS